MSTDTINETNNSERFLVFSLRDQDYAIPLLNVKEVIAIPEITPIPYSPSHFKGIMNLRGQIISVIDLRLKFKFPPSDQTQETAIIILDLDSVFFGVIVDTIDCVLAVESADLRPSPDIDNQTRHDCITGVTQKGEKLVLVLDIHRTLSIEDRNTLRKASQSAA
jgi:purine-binding chemotaxis protein CheW